MSELVTKTLAGLYNGVSQQAQTMRLETQHADQVNFDSTIVDGLFKRYGTRFMGFMMALYDGSKPYLGSIVRDSYESYIYMITSDGYIKVWDKAGNVMSVVYGVMDFTDYTYTADDSVRTEYLINQTDEARLLFDTITVADFTFISRRDRSPRMTSEVFGDDGSNVTKTVTTTSESTWSNFKESSTISTEIQPDGSIIVTTIEKVITGTSTTINNITTTNYDVIKTVMATTAGTIVAEYQSFADLEDAVQDETFTPSVGVVVQINGDPDKSDSQYWVIYEDSHLWKECVCPGHQYELDASTMPHALVRAADGTFVFTALSWGDRQVGSDKTNPVPSFVGSRINSMYFFRNRLVFMSPTSVVMSKPGDYFELFSTTSLETLDSDPIDIGANTKQVTNIHKAEVVGRRMLLYSDRQQFTVHSNDDPMTPSTVQIDPGTTYETTEESGTTTCGTSAFFISPKKDWVDLMEYENTLDEDSTAAQPVSSHCPEFIPNGFITMVSSPADSMVIMHSDATPSSLWVYRYQTVQDTRAQSAFSEWRFTEDIEGIVMLDSSLVLLQKLDGGLVMNWVDLGGEPDYALGWNVRLDRGVTLDSTDYDSEALTSQLTLPYAWHDDLMVIDTTTGRAVSSFEETDTGIQLNGVLGAGTYMVGLKYTGWTTLSPWYIKTSKGTSIIDGRLQVRNVSAQYQQTGYFQVIISNEGRTSRISEWTNNIIGKMRYGTSQLFDGKFKVGVRGRNTTTNIKISSASHLPVQIAAIAYEGTFVQRARAI